MYLNYRQVRLCSHCSPFDIARHDYHIVISKRKRYSSSTRTIPLPQRHSQRECDMPENHEGRYAQLPPPSGSIPKFVSEPDFRSHHPSSLSLFYQPRRTPKAPTGSLVFSSHNTALWRLSHEGAQLLMRQGQWHAATRVMPAQDSAHGSCVALAYERTNHRAGQRPGTTFCIWRTMLSPTVDSAIYLN